MTLDGGQGRRSLLRLWVWLGFWLGLFVMTHVPVVGGGILSFDFADKIIHLVLYSLLVWLGGRYLIVTDRVQSASTLIVFAGIYAAYAAFDEWSQQFVGRTTSLGDWFADALGIVLATFWLVLRRRSSAVPGPSR